MRKKLLSLSANCDNMKHVVHLILLCIILFSFENCGDSKSVRQLPHIGNTPYQQDSIMVAYATNPKRALTLLDSALRLGNISDYRGQFIRAKIYSSSLVEQSQDSAIIICKELLKHDSVRNEPVEQQNILDILIATSRAKHDFEQYMHWATQKAELCQKQGEETERWRTEADIGLVMTHLGQEVEGLAKLDEAIGRLDTPGSIDRMDAFIVAVKRKINAQMAQNRFPEVILLARRILDRLDHYEQHTKDYAEDSHRLSWSDNPNDRDRYLDFSRAQAWAFMAQGYAAPLSSPEGGVRDSALYYLSLFNNSQYGKTFNARRMIAPTQMALGMYDEALSTYDEVVRRMAGDTLNEDYAVILRSYAIAACAKGHIAEALAYQTRYADLSKVVSDSLHKSEAHEYAVRYHLQEEQLKTQEAEADSRLKSYIIGVCLLLFVIALAVSLYYYYQKRIVSEKNRALIRMINDSLSASSEPAVCESSSETTELFTHIDYTIRNNRLYKNVNLQRQDICDSFGINRHALNDLLAEHTGGLSFPQYVNTIRLEEALRLLHDKCDMTISAIAAEVGFTPANLREQFKRKYGMTPVEYRQNQ